MELVDLIKWLPQGGAAGAVILVVYLFLKQQDKGNALLMTVTDKFTATITEHQTRSDDRLAALTRVTADAAAAQHKTATENAAATQATVNTLVRDSIVSNTQMTDAIRGLQVAVTETNRKDRA